MSNTQHPKAAMNGQGQKRPAQLDVLIAIAGATQALAQHATAQQPPARLHCAPCLGRMKSWELKHEQAVRAISEQYQAMMEQFGAALGAAAGDPEQQQALLARAPNLRAMCEQYGTECGDPMPQVNEAQFVITMPGWGTAAVCALEVPPSEAADPTRKRLMAASGPLSSGMVAAVRAM